MYRQHWLEIEELNDALAFFVCVTNPLKVTTKLRIVLGKYSVPHINQKGLYK